MKKKAEQQPAEGRDVGLDLADTWFRRRARQKAPSVSERPTAAVKPAIEHGHKRDCKEGGLVTGRGHNPDTLVPARTGRRRRSRSAQRA